MAETGVSQMEGQFKEVYGDGPVRLVPETDELAKMCPFVKEQQREGNSFNVPVVLTQEHGFTYNTDGSAFTLNGGVSHESKNATVNGAEMVLQSTLSYAAMQKALKTGGESGLRAFVNATKFQVENAVKSSSKRRELELLYGAGTTIPDVATGDVLNWGEVLTNSGGGSIILTSASWCTAIWSGGENMTLDCYNSDGTQRNTNADLVVSTVDPAAETIVVTGNASDLSAIATGDYFFPAGARTKQMASAFKTAVNTGTLHGISAATYQLWKGSDSNVGGALSFAKVMSGLERPAALGFAGEMCVLVNTASWQDINEDQAALRRYVGAAGGDVSQGAEELTFFGQTGKVTIKPYIYMKRGHALAIPVGNCQRVGATDTTFEMPDGQGKIFRQLETKAGIEFRCYSNQSYFSAHPAWHVAYSGIVPTTPSA